MAEELQLILTAVDRMSGQIEIVTQKLSGLEKTGQQVEAGMGDMRASFLGAGKALLTLAAGFVSLQAGISFLKKSVVAAKESQEEQLQLKRQVESTGVSWDKYSQQIQGVIKSVSDYAVVQDEEASAALRRMILISGDVEASMTNLRLAFDLAAAKGIDLQQAADLVARASGGNVEMLARFIPQLRNLDEQLGKNATAAEKAEFALKVLSERTSGAAGTMPDLTRATKELEVAWNEFAETLGNKVAPALTRILEIIKSMLEGKGLGIELVGRLSQLDPEMQKVIATIRSGKDPFIDLGKAAKDSFQVASTITKELNFDDNIAGLERFADSLDMSLTPAQEFSFSINSAMANLGLLNMAQLEFDSTLSLHNEQIGLTLGNYDLLNQKITEYQTKVIAAGKTKVITDQLETMSQMRKQQAMVESLNFIAGSALNQYRGLYVLARAAAIGQATMDTYAAANKAMAAFPPPLSFIMAAITIAAGLANVASIVSAPKPMAEGGIVTGPTMALIGEAGPEAVIPLRETGAFPSGETHLHLHYDGPILMDRQQIRKHAQILDSAFNELFKRNMSAFGANFKRA